MHASVLTVFWLHVCSMNSKQCALKLCLTVTSHSWILKVGLSLKHWESVGTNIDKVPKSESSIKISAASEGEATIIQQIKFHTKHSNLDVTIVYPQPDTSTRPGSVTHFQSNCIHHLLANRARHGGMVQLRGSQTQFCYGRLCCILLKI